MSRAWPRKKRADAGKARASAAGIGTPVVIVDDHTVEPALASETSLRIAAPIEVDERPLILRLGPGLHRDIPAEEYHRRVLGMASKGSLDELHRSPLRYLAWARGELLEEQSDAFDLGAAAHCRLLEPSLYARLFGVLPKIDGRPIDRRTKVGKDAYASWQAEHPGARALTEDQTNAVERIRDAVLTHEMSGPLFEEEGDSELTVRWKDPLTGIECRARIDRWARRGWGTDLKTTGDARPRVFAKSVGNYSYFRQAALYADGLAVAGHPLEEDLDGLRFFFVSVESKPPWDVSVSRLDEAAWRLGRRTIAEDLAILARCLEQDRWPGCNQGIAILSVPPYVEREW